MSSAAKRILVVEDNENMAYGLRTSLELEGMDAQVAHDGLDALRRARDWQPDLILLDLMLPQVDGYHVLKTLRDEGITVPVLVLTALGAEPDKLLGFRLGADDYVTKPCGRLEIIARVHALLRRGRTWNDSPPFHRFGDIEVNRAARAVTRADQPVPLTPREFELLCALIDRHGAVISRSELLRDVWGHRGEVETRTVDLHIAELRRKLEKDPANPRHILTVRKVGYRFEAQTDNG
jgi:two-component system response regulator MtrA